MDILAPPDSIIADPLQIALLYANLPRDWIRRGVKPTALSQSSISPTQLELHTRPSSASKTPLPVLEGTGGLNAFERVFAFELECALSSVLADDEDNEKAGKGREALLKLRSKKQLWSDAWRTPTGWADSDIPSPASSSEEDVTCPKRLISVADLHREISGSVPEYCLSAAGVKGDGLARGVEPQVVEPASADEQRSSEPALKPCKRKIVDDDEDGEKAVKRVRRSSAGTAHKSGVILNDFTPPATPPSPSGKLGFTATAMRRIDATEAVRCAAQGGYLQSGEDWRGTETRSSVLGRRSERLQDPPAIQRSTLVD